MDKIFVTAIVTLSVTVCGFVIGQLIQRFMLEPVQELKKTIGEIRFRLHYYANVSPTSKMEENGALWNRLLAAKDAFRESALLLETKTAAIPIYDLFAAIHFIPERSNVDKASRNFIFISNNTFEKDREERRERRRQMDEVRQLLRMKSITSPGVNLLEPPTS